MNLTLFTHAIRRFPINICALRNSSRIPLPEIPPTFKDVVLPEHRKLPVMAKIPHYYVNQKPPRLRMAHWNVRGPELVHNTLHHKQYGIIALSGGYLNFEHFEVIRNGINRWLDTRNTFAVWRVDPPWKPVSKKSIGKRMGGGKGNVHHYSTAVKAGRIVIEVGGKVEFEEVYHYLDRVANKLPFWAMAISQEKLEQLDREEKEMAANNINPFNFQYVMDNNMQSCNLWTSPIDKEYGGTYY